MHHNSKCCFFTLTTIFFFSGCSPTTLELHQETSALANQKNWTYNVIKAEKFSISSYIPQNHTNNSEHLTIFIEGDGFAWIDKYTPSDNPTAKNPIALKVALRHHKDNSAYLGRVCQNVLDKDWFTCNEKYWTSDRFSPEVIEAMNTAVSSLKRTFNAQDITLIGYSGGGVVALLVASQRQDIVKVITLAGNIDTDTWTQYHHISTLHGSNPALLHEKLSSIEQLHFVGSKDTIVPLVISQSYVKYYPKDKEPRIKIVEGFTHNCCWENIEVYWEE